jgi:hypothetical protein
MQTAIAFGMGELGFGYWWVSLLIAFASARSAIMPITSSFTMLRTT